MPATRPPERGYLTMADLAVYLNTEVETLRAWRKRGYGPPGVRLGHRVQYSWAAIKKWEAERVADERRRQGEVA